MFSCSDSFKSTAPRKSKGFSLIELMVVVAIIGIITAVALPAYRDYILQSRLVDLQNSLAAARVRAEQFHQDRRSYVGMPCPANTSDVTFVCSDIEDNRFTVSAAGHGFNLDINHLNVRRTNSAPSGWATSATCWITKKSGC